MISIALAHLPLLDVAGESAEKICHGFDQEWYPDKWQRCAGCGPTVAAQVTFYFDRTRVRAACPAGPVPKSAALDRMETAWQYVTPTPRGIPSTRLFRTDFEAYARAGNLPLRPECLDIPRRRAERPDPRRVAQFIAQALAGDMPVAFLNLHNGSEQQLDSWHWVLLVSLSYEADGSAATAVILDEGLQKPVDLGLWLATTALGGGFVRFSAAP